MLWQCAYHHTSAMAISGAPMCVGVGLGLDVDMDVGVGVGVQCYYNVHTITQVLW